MPLIIHFVDEKKEIQEQFIIFINCEHETGVNITVLIKNSCHDVGWDIDHCRGQGYDGAGNMAGATKGAASIISRGHLFSLFVP